MSALITALLVIIGLVPVAELDPCATEDSTDGVCGWDASERGNGVGRDFVSVYGVKVYLS